MLTDAPVASPAGRKGFLELALETAGFERVAIQPQPVLALYGLGLLKGLVLDVGHGVSVAVRDELKKIGTMSASSLKFFARESWPL